MLSSSKPAAARPAASPRPSDAELLRASATRIAAWIRQGVVSSRDVIEAHIAQIQRTHAVVNAVVRDRFTAARAEADAADADLAANRRALPPFHGVPCTIKECFALTGMPQTSGLVARVGHVAEGDATTVARLRAAGAIPLGVTNLSELCMWHESNNRVYGRTNNPYDPTRMVGGSSGGEGAVIGAGGSPFGLGSDVGGSIRMPAFFNGVFGHKPTGGLVPNTGQYPSMSGAGARYLVSGPLARRAEDLMPLLRVLAGPDGQDAGCQPSELGDPATVDVAKLSVVTIADNGRLDVAPELRQAQARVAAALAERGARVREASVGALYRSFEIWSAMMSAASDTPFRVLLGNGKPVRAGLEMVRLALGRSPHTLPALGLALLERLPEMMPGGKDKMIALGRSLREELVRLIGDDGVLLYPSFHSVAPRHGWALWPPLSWGAYTGIFNMMELPSTQVPLGLGAEGLPLGVQVVSVHGKDHVTIAVALELERIFGGWTPPRLVPRAA